MGTLSHGLATLKVAGNRIVEAATLRPVMLRGVNRSGLEYSQTGAGITAEEIQEITGGWGANVVRLPFNQAWALGQPGYDPSRYLEALDFVIDQAAARTLDALKESVVRLHIRSSGSLPPALSVPHAHRCRIEGQHATVTVTHWAPEQRAALAERLAAEVEVEPLALEDIFLELHA